MTEKYHRAEAGEDVGRGVEKAENGGGWGVLGGGGRKMTPKMRVKSGKKKGVKL